MNREQLHLLERELAKWPSVTYEVVKEGRSRHPKIVLEYGECRRFVVFSSTYVGHRALKNNVSNLRRVLRDMGVTQ